MRAIVYDSNNPTLPLSIQDHPTPIPTSDQLLVKVKAFGINRADLLQRKGNYPIPPGESSILGLEIAGEVAKAPPGAPFQVGDRVFGLVGGGAYAEFCTIPVSQSMRIPDSMSFEEAASIPEIFFTAAETLFETGQLSTGESVLIHAAGSGVGTAAVQLAKAREATVYATVGSEQKRQRVLELGADYAFNYSEPDFVPKVEAELGGKLHLIHDPMGGKYLETHLKLLREKGRMVHYALLGGRTGTLDLSQMMYKRLSLRGFVLRRQSLEEKTKITERFLKHTLPLLQSGRIRPIIDRIFDWGEINEAHLHLENRANFGKTVVRVGL